MYSQFFRLYGSSHVWPLASFQGLPFWVNTARSGRFLGTKLSRKHATRAIGYTLASSSRANSLSGRTTATVIAPASLASGMSPLKYTCPASRTSITRALSSVRSINANTLPSIFGSPAFHAVR